MDIEKRNELVEFLMELRDDEGELKSKLKALREEIEGIETELIESMVETENLTFKYKNATITVYMTERVSPEPDCKDDLWAAFRKESERLIDEGETGYEGLFTINPQTLQGTVKDLKANNHGYTHQDWFGEKMVMNYAGYIYSNEMGINTRYLRGNS